jgi:hypothetical protein
VHPEKGDPRLMMMIMAGIWQGLAARGRELRDTGY